MQCQQHGLYNCSLCTQLGALTVSYDVPQAPLPQSQQYQGYNTGQQYPNPLPTFPSHYGPSGDAMQSHPPSDRQSHSFHGQQTSDPRFGAWYGSHSVVPPRPPFEQSAGTEHVQYHDYIFNQGFQFPPPLKRPGPSASPTFPKRPMKHMTCFYWHTYKNCKYPEPLCLYSHSYDGKVGIAGAPIHKEPGKPAVAGNNAKQENPVYHDWTPNRGVITLRSGRSNTMGPPEVNHDIKNPTVEHGSHGMDVDRPTTLYAELQGGQEVGYDEKLVKEEGDDGERHSPPKHIKRSSSFPPAEQSLLSALQDVEAQNVFLRKTVEELAQVVCVSMSGRIVALKNQSEGCYQLMQEIAKLPTNRHDALSKPLNHITRGMQEHVAVDDAATKAMVEVRDKLLGAGLGGLLTVLDKNFCATAAEQARAQVSEASTSGDTGSGA